MPSRSGVSTVTRPAAFCRRGARMKLVGDISAVAVCANLKVLYAYENRLTTLRGLGGLHMAQ